MQLSFVHNIIKKYGKFDGLGTQVPSRYEMFQNKTGKVKAEKSLLSLSRGWSFESKTSIWRIFFGKKGLRLRESDNP